MKLLLYLFAGLILVSCSLSDPEIVNEEPEDPWENPLEGLPFKGQVRFDGPEIGQRSYYVYFKAHENNVTKEITFEYFKDTLVVAITGKEDDKWIIRQFLTPGSLSMTTESGSWSSLKSVYERHLQIDADSIYLSRPADAEIFSFIFIGAKRSLPLSVVSDPAPENPKCLPAFKVLSTEWVQYTQNYTQFGQFFTHLNNYFDYTPMAFDGLGFMYAYAPSYGLVRWTWVNYWDPEKADGWDLIPN